MKIRTLVLAALAGTAALAATASTASARVICNREGDCWRTHSERYDYQPSWGLTVHEDDNWRWRDSDRARYRWRDYHRGYYGKGGVWITF